LQHGDDPDTRGRRPNRERENPVGQRTRIVNRMKACLARFGIRNFNPTLRKASERLETLSTPEGSPLPKGRPHLNKSQRAMVEAPRVGYARPMLVVSRELDRLELLLEHIKAVETERRGAEHHGYQLQ
jgi:transposase